MKSVRLSRRGALFIPATLLVIGCERSPTSDAGISGPSFSVVASITTLDLGTLGGNASVAAALNAAGHVAGRSTTATGEEHAFFWDGTTMRDLGTLGGNFSDALALNGAGQVAGTSTTASGDQHAFFWDGTTMRDLGTLGGNTSVAFAVNDAGEVAGRANTTSGEGRATRWTVTLRPATPSEEIEIIRTALNSLVTTGTLSQGQATGLLAKLDAATRQLNGGNGQAAKNILQAFIQQVRSFIADGILSAADGQVLIDAAQNAINQLTA